jgi:hypothetical protein
MWAQKSSLWLAGEQGAVTQFGHVVSEVNWAPRAELAFGGENLKPESAMVAESFSKNNI